MIECLIIREAEQDENKAKWLMPVWTQKLKM